MIIGNKVYKLWCTKNGFKEKHFHQMSINNIGEKHLKMNLLLITKPLI